MLNRVVIVPMVGRSERIKKKVLKEVKELLREV